MRPLLLCVLMLFGVAHAETGRGEAPRVLGSVLNAVDAPTLENIERDVVRFSSTPSLGNRGYIITFVGAAGGAWADVVWLDGHWRTGWGVTRRERIELEPSEYEWLANTIDDIIAEGEPAIDPDPEERVICVDGPGYLSERLVDGGHIWIAGQCLEEHPNNQIAKVVFGWLLDRLGDDDVH
jgi:hypothetical protein